MVELPDEDDSRAVSKLASSARLLSLQSGHLTAALHKLEGQYASLVGAYEASLAEQQESAGQIRSELRRLKDQQEVIVAQVGTLIVEHDYTVTLEQSKRDLGTGGHHLGGGAGRLERTLDERPSLASTIDNVFATDPGDVRSWVSETNLSALPSPIFPALQIARRLEDTRREAMQSKREQRFTVDVAKRVFGTHQGTELVQLDRDLNLSLDTATSEVIDEHSGRIRFFPDGSSTGGRIQLQRGRAAATVNVDWSTGDVTVQVLGD